MLKIKIIAVGKIKETALTQVINEYIKRLGKYCALEIIEVRDESIAANNSESDIVKFTRMEADRLIAHIKPGVYTIALDSKGDAPDSVVFAHKLESLTARLPEIHFIIGGSHGLHFTALRGADYIMSMSNMTFPHQLARLIFLEQLYRAFKIINNETYHK